MMCLEYVRQFGGRLVSHSEAVSILPDIDAHGVCDHGTS